MVHFSTNDCLYRAHGAWADINMNWNGGELALVGTPLSTDFDVIGEEGEEESEVGVLRRSTCNPC